MTDVLDRIKEMGHVFIDAWVAVGPDRTVLAFNRHYRALFSRAQARSLEGSQCCQHLGLAVCANGGACLARQCLQAGPTRYDEIEAQVEGEDTPRKFIVSAAPIGDAEGGPVALLLMRDVSDQADVQRKYRTMLETETRARDRLEQELGRRTRELKEANMALNRLQQELVRFRKGLFG
jgi:hypothetical protein